MQIGSLHCSQAESPNILSIYKYLFQLNVIIVTLMWGFGAVSQGVY